MQICNGAFQVKSFINEALNELNTPIALLLPRLCCPPDAARRRRLRTQLSADVAECGWGAHLREKALCFLCDCNERNLAPT